MFPRTGVAVQPALLRVFYFTNPLQHFTTLVLASVNSMQFTRRRNRFDDDTILLFVNEHFARRFNPELLS